MKHNKNKKPEKRTEQQDRLRAFAFLSQLAFTIVGCIGLGVFLGIWLDGVFGTSPWMVLVGSVLGMAAAFMSMYSLANKK